MKKKITVIFTCFNRKDKTITAMKSIVENNSQLLFQFIIVDDCSTDGTVEAIKELNYDVEIIQGTGKLYWCGGMRIGIDRYFENNDKNDCLLINDDVVFYSGAIEKIVMQAANRKDVVIVGATCDNTGKITYGLRVNRGKKGIWLNYIEPNKEEICGETMNANCVLIPHAIMKQIGNMDTAYSHSLGDYDLGFRISKMGYKLISSETFIGVCEENGFEKTWRDSTLPRKERLKKKESPKGSPFREWWHYLYKNYGIKKSIIYSVVPYVKILLGK